MIDGGQGTKMIVRDDVGVKDVDPYLRYGRYLGFLRKVLRKVPQATLPYLVTYFSVPVR